MDRVWVDYANAIGGVATFFTLVFVLIKEWRTRKQVTDLTVIASELSKHQEQLKIQNDIIKQQMKAEAQPIWNVESQHKDVGRVQINIINNGGKAIIKEVYPANDSLKYRALYERETYRGDFIRLIVGGGESTISFQNHFRIFIQYCDVYANYYSTVVINENNKTTLETADVVAPKLRTPATVL